MKRIGLTFYSLPFLVHLGRNTIEPPISQLLPLPWMPSRTVGSPLSAPPCHFPWLSPQSWCTYPRLLCLTSDLWFLCFFLSYCLHPCFLGWTCFLACLPAFLLTFFHSLPSVERTATCCRRAVLLRISVFWKLSALPIFLSSKLHSEYVQISFVCHPSRLCKLSQRIPPFLVSTLSRQSFHSLPCGAESLLRI